MTHDEKKWLDRAMLWVVLIMGGTGFVVGFAWGFWVAGLVR